MTVDSLNDLKIAARTWRRQKRHLRESASTELLMRARRAVAVHGLSAVIKATQFTRSRLSDKGGGKAPKGRRKVPSYSRVEIAAPSASTHPLVEAETSSGMKLRIFQITPETLGLLTGLCGSSGVR